MNLCARTEVRQRRLQLPFSLTSFFSVDLSARVSGIGFMAQLHAGQVDIPLTMIFTNFVI